MWLPMYNFDFDFGYTHDMIGKKHLKVHFKQSLSATFDPKIEPNLFIILRKFWLAICLQLFMIVLSS